VANKPLYAAISCNRRCFIQKYTREKFSNIKVLLKKLIVKTVEKISELGVNSIIFNAYTGLRKYLTEVI